MTNSSDQFGLMKEYSNFANKVENTVRKISVINDADVRIAETPREEVFKSDKMTIYHYIPVVKNMLKNVVKTPVLMVYGLIGRQTMTDLQEDRSLVKNLLELGIDLYIVDWGTPSRADRWLTIDDYVDGYMDEGIDFLRQASGCDSINLFGICEGGTFAACYASLYPEKINNLLLAITPIDFHADQEQGRIDHGFINIWARGLDGSSIDKLVEANGCMPGELMGYVFQLITPMRSLTKYNLDLIDLAEDDGALLNFLRMEKWIADRPDHPGEAAKQWFKDYYQQNKLIKDEIYINGRKVELKNLTMPILNIFATHDHIIPPDCSSALSKYVASKDYSELELNAGHVGLFVSSKSQAILAPGIAKWLHDRK